MTFRFEQDLVEVVTQDWEPSRARERDYTWYREVSMGARIADALMVVLSTVPRHRPPLHRASLRELRLVGELLQRPLRAATLAQRLYCVERTVESDLRRLERLSLVERVGSSAWTITAATEALVPSYTAALEGKLTDWRSAVRQASYYLPYVDHSYVAMPTTMRGNSALRAECRRAGVGLLLVRPCGEAAQVVRPRRQFTGMSGTGWRVALGLHMVKALTAEATQ